jgi:hypothetical protein
VVGVGLEGADNLKEMVDTDVNMHKKGDLQAIP